MFVVLLLGVGFGWWGSLLQRSREQERAVRAIEALGGKVKLRNVSNTALFSEWLGARLGRSVSIGVEVVWLPRARDADLVDLVAHVQFDVLSLRGSELSDAGLVHLSRQSQLRVLWIEGTQISDSGLAQLKNLKQLKVLRIFGAQVTPDGIRDLQSALPNCKIYSSASVLRTASAHMTVLAESVMIANRVRYVRILQILCGKIPLGSISISSISMN